jgi:hypothetical protein
VGVWASQNGHVQYVYELDIIYILGKSLDQAGVFPAFDPGSHGFADGHGKPPLCVNFLSGVLNGVHDVLVAGTATEVPLDAASNFSLGRFCIAFEKLVNADDHPGCAKATLKAMALPKAFLDGVQVAILGKTFDGGDFRTVRLYGQCGAGFNR